MPEPSTNFDPRDPEGIRRMFEGLAPDYDFLNDLLTFGLVRGWRRALVRAARLEPGDRVLDVCSGTGAMLPYIRGTVGSEATVVGADYTPAMLERASGIRLLADAIHLPFPDDVFEASVSAFAFRDVADQQGMVREMARVTRPGGRVAVLDIGPPRGRMARMGFDLWFRGAVPVLAGLFGQGEPYRFLVRSVAYLPSPRKMKAMLGRAGVERVVWRDLFFGAARLFVGPVGDADPRALPRPGTGREGIPRREAGLG